jgi:hypothetical protein
VAAHDRLLSPPPEAGELTTAAPVRVGALVAGLIALALAAGGCDGDDEETTTGARPNEPTETRAEERPAETSETSETVAPEPEPETATTERTPEEEPGGAGDEEPARSLALFTGRGGEITPRVVRVPAFIAIRVELRAADSRRYGLRFGSRRLAVKGGLSSVSTTLDGLRPGAAVVGTPTGAGNAVRIEATAEPGP